MDWHRQLNNSLKIWSDKMKQEFFWVVAVSVLLYSCTTWTFMTYLKKKLDGNYKNMLCAVLTKSWKQQTTKQKVHGHLPPISQTIQVRRARLRKRNKDKLVSNVLWTPIHGHTSVGWPVKTYILQLCLDTGYCLKDLAAVVIVNRWQESVKGICAVALMN